MSHRFHRFTQIFDFFKDRTGLQICVNLWNLWDIKIFSEKKNLRAQILYFILREISEHLKRAKPHAVLSICYRKSSWTDLLRGEQPWLLIRYLLQAPYIPKKIVWELTADRTNHILYREAEEITHRLMTYRNGLQVVQKCWTVIPRRLFTLVDYIISILGADRDKYHVLDIECLRHLLVVCDNLIIYIFTEINQVHLVDSHQNMRYSEKRRNIAVTYCLLQYTMSCIDENDAQGAGSSGVLWFLQVGNTTWGVKRLPYRE